MLQARGVCYCDCFFFFFSSRRRHTRCSRDWSSDVCSSDLSVSFTFCRPASRLMLINAMQRPREINTKIMTPIRFFIAFYNAGQTGLWQGRTTPNIILNKETSLLNCSHEDTVRGAGDDPPQCHVVSPSFAPALYLRAKVSPNALGRP